MLLSLKSSAFEHNGRIPVMYTCDGKNINPPLQISGIPKNTKSLVLILEDPDAHMHTWDHWLVYDIDPTQTKIDEGKEPVGTHGKGSGENVVYIGPCPPTGIHHYHFKLFALDSLLMLPEGLYKADVLKAMEGHVIGHVELVGLYGRKNL